MRSWVKVLIVVLFTNYTSVRADSVKDEVNANQGAECSVTECAQLRNRIETLEVAVRGIISAMASQKAGQLASVNKILERNVALRAIVSSATIGSGVPNNETLRNDKEQKQNIEQQAKSYSSQLKSALKCSLAHLLDINSSADFKTSDKIQASLTENNALEITWIPATTECLKVSSGVWLRVFESSEKQLIQPSAEAYLSIPPRCWKKTNGSYSIVLPKPSAGVTKENSCLLELKNDWIQCLVYTVEVIPNYKSLKGRPLLAEMIIPPANDNSTERRESLISLVSETDSLALTWKDNSGCAPWLTAVNLKIFPEGKLSAAQVPLSLNIPRRCLQFESGQNVFSVKLSRDQACPVQLQLDGCRKYMLELKSEYQNKFARPPTLWNTFTTEKEVYPQKNIENSNCSDSQFACFDNQCIPHSWACDSDRDCSDGEDELLCNNECNDGFQCGSQCIFNSRVCDGKRDCVDGSDEMSQTCESFERYSSSLCYEVKPYTAQSYNTIKSERFQRSKSAVLISAEDDNTIWLSTNRFRTDKNHFLKVYDGPYSNSPLLLSHSGSTRPPSVRSSFNKLYLEFPSYSDKDFGVGMFFTTMNNIGGPFVPGCGGYVSGDGVISFQNSFLSAAFNVTDCIWIVDAPESDRTIRLTRNMFPVSGTTGTSMELAYHLDTSPTMIVYDGWGLSGQLLYDERTVTDQARKSAVYSISHKITVQFIRPLNTMDHTAVYWNVFSLEAPKYTKLETAGSSGIIKSLDFEYLRDNDSDFRWHIVTTPNATIQLLFAVFETQNSDCVQVYDGSTMRSRVLLEESGKAVSPLVVTSSTNELLVRYTLSQGDHVFPSTHGFVAVYSTL